MRHSSILLITVVATILPSCATPEKKFTPVIEGGATTQPVQEGAWDDAPILCVRLRMVTIEAPVGTISESEQLWSYLNEEPVASSRYAAGLGRNGFRIGLGRKDAWADMAGVLKQMTGRTLQESEAVALRGNPLKISLKTDQPEQVIFTYYNDRTLCGLSYAPGDNVLSLTFTLDDDDPFKIMVTGLPQIRSLTRKPTMVRDGGKFRMAQASPTSSFDPLTFQFTIPSGDFIVIGPNSQSRRRSSVGYHFLINNKEGTDFETVLVLAPEVITAHTKSAEPPVGKDQTQGGNWKAQDAKQ